MKNQHILFTTNRNVFNKFCLLQNKLFCLKANSFLILVISTSLKIANSPPKSTSNMEEEEEESIETFKTVSTKRTTKEYWVY